jgi:hypothetical protein
MIWSSNLGADIVMDFGLGEVTDGAISDSLGKALKIQVYPNDDCKSAIHTLGAVSEINKKVQKFYYYLERADRIFKENCPCTYDTGIGDTLNDWVDTWQDTAEKMQSHQEKAEKEVIKKCTGQ